MIYLSFGSVFPQRIADYTDFWASAAPAIRIVLHPAIVASCDEKSV